MQSVLVFLVLLQADGEAGIVGVCKGIYGIVDELSGGVVVQQVPAFFLLQAPGDAAHEMLGVFVVMPPEPLGPDRAFQVGGGIAVRFDAAQQKSGPVRAGNLGKIGIYKVIAQLAMAFSTHIRRSLLFLSGSSLTASHYSTVYRKSVNIRKS